MDRKITTSIVIVAIAVIIGGAVFLSKNQKADTATNVIPTTNTSSSSTSQANTSFKDGTYTATGTYESPDGTQQIGVTMTIADGTVTSTSAQNKANGGDSVQYEDRFIADYKSVVVGKKLSSLSGTISGDSLTVAGFEDALTQIKNQAKA